jgi:hypothetical protein
MTTQNIYSLVDVWNAAGTTFTGIGLSVTDTASASGSLLMDLQVGGSSRFSIGKAGIVTLSQTGNTTASLQVTGGGGNSGFGSANGFDWHYARAGSPMAFFGFERFDVGSGSITWASSVGGTADVVLRRDAANTLAQRNGTNAQQFRVYGTFTDASNLRRLVMNMSAAGVAEIKPEGLGTGASGNVLHISGLPTANPGAGILWNNGGTVEVGT